MADYIRREDAIEAIRRSPITNMGTKLFCYDEIGDIPAANVVERKRGKWISNGDVENCSECGGAVWTIDSDLLLRSEEHYNYCPNCGAEMQP